MAIKWLSSQLKSLSSQIHYSFNRGNLTWKIKFKSFGRDKRMSWGQGCYSGSCSPPRKDPESKQEGPGTGALAEARSLDGSWPLLPCQKEEGEWLASAVLSPPVSCWVSHWSNLGWKVLSTRAPRWRQSGGRRRESESRSVEEEQVSCFKHPVPSVLETRKDCTPSYNQRESTHTF